MKDIGGAGGGIVIQRLGRACHDIPARHDRFSVVLSCPPSVAVSGARSSAAPLTMSMRRSETHGRDDTTVGRNQALAMTRPPLPGRASSVRRRSVHVIAQDRGHRGWLRRLALWHRAVSVMTPPGGTGMTLTASHQPAAKAAATRRLRPPDTPPGRDTGRPVSTAPGRRLGRSAWPALSEIDRHREGPVRQACVRQS